MKITINVELIGEDSLDIICKDKLSPQEIGKFIEGIFHLSDMLDSNPEAVLKTVMLK